MTGCFLTTIWKPLPSPTASPIPIPSCCSPPTPKVLVPSGSARHSLLPNSCRQSLAFHQNGFLKVWYYWASLTKSQTHVKDLVSLNQQGFLMNNYQSENKVVKKIFSKDVQRKWLKSLIILYIASYFISLILGFVFIIITHGILFGISRSFLYWKPVRTAIIKMIDSSEDPMEYEIPKMPWWGYWRVLYFVGIIWLGIWLSFKIGFCGQNFIIC